MNSYCFLELSVKVVYYSFDGLQQPNFELFSKMFQNVLPFSIYCFPSLLPFYVKLEQFKRQQMAKMKDRVPTERLGTSRLKDVFLKIYTFDPTSKFSGIRNWL